MNIILGADHRGFALKEALKSSLITNHQGLGTIVDCSSPSLNPNDDYTDIALKAIERLRPSDLPPEVLTKEGALAEGDRAILICGSGHGMDITANRFPHIRAILGFNSDVVKQGREHEDANVLVLPADWTTVDQALELTNLFLTTPASNDPRHIRRRQKLSSLITNH